MSTLDSQSAAHADADTDTDVEVEVDVAIAGGGIAGAWLLRLLTNKGYRVALFEPHGWGADQTLASQGMIHGGLKYALSGHLSGASEAIAEMPARWRACFKNQAEVDLQGTHIVSDNYYMFAQASAMGKLTTFFAAKALRGRIDKVEKELWPEAFDGFRGVVYRLNDFVIDTASLLESLTADLTHQSWQLALDAGCVKHTSPGWEISTPDQVIRADCLISCAGNGSADLMMSLNIANFEVQTRPLKQVSVRPKHNVSLWGHCLTGVTGSEPRLTITSHHEDGLVWYLGGKLASEGVNRSDDEQLRTAQSELMACVPWLDWRDAEFAVHAINRAEPKQTTGLKPDQAYAKRQGDFIQCFPTKLTLTPDLGDRVVALLPTPRSANAGSPASSLASTSPVPFTHPPWHRHDC